MLVVEDFQEIYGRYTPQMSDNVAIVLNAQLGVSPQAFFEVVVLTGLQKDQVAAMFHTSLKTIQRYSESGKKMDILFSEQALKMIALFAKGNAIFGDLQAFRNWLGKPQHGLGQAIPWQFMQTISGIDLVMEELFRIEFGALA